MSSQGSEAIEPCASLTHLSEPGKRAYEFVKLHTIIQACQAVSELETRTKKELRTLANKNYKKIIQKADFNLLCPEIGCDVPPEQEHALLKRILMTRNIEGEDCAKVSVSTLI